MINKIIIRGINFGLKGVYKVKTSLNLFLFIIISLLRVKGVFNLRPNISLKVYVVVGIKPELLFLYIYLLYNANILLFKVKDTGLNIT